MNNFDDEWQKSIQISYHRSLHAYLFYAADWIRTVEATQLNTAEQDGKRRIEIFKFLGYVSFVCFSVESFFNFVGEYELGASWNERANVDAKFDSIVKSLGLATDLNKGSRPYQSIRRAFDCRDAIAHAKPKHISGTFDKFQSGELTDSLEVELKSDFCVERLSQDVKVLFEKIWVASKIGKELPSCSPLDMPDFL